MYFYKAIKTLASILFRLIFRIEIKGEDNVLATGRLVLCSNHTSLFDPIMLAIAIPRPIHFMAKRELFANKILGKILSSLGAFPVDRDGSDMAAIRSSFRILKEESILGIFPQGTRVKDFDIDNVKAGIALIAIRGKAPIVPVYIDSKYNIFGKVNIRIGEPIYFEEYYGQKLTTETYKDISKNIMESIYLLKSV